MQCEKTWISTCWRFGNPPQFSVYSVRILHKFTENNLRFLRFDSEFANHGSWSANGCCNLDCSWQPVETGTCKEIYVLARCAQSGQGGKREKGEAERRER